MLVDLNCDMGESFGHYNLGDDETMLRTVTSANIACGLHAGDPVVMARTVGLAKRNRVSVGAHPGYPDLQGFGRRDMELSANELESILIYQIGALAGFVRTAGIPLVHVKLHGALYNTVARNAALAETVARAIVAFDPRLVVIALPVSALEKAARTLNLRVAREGFADRAYRADGTLVPRSEPGAVIHDPIQAADQAVRMVTRNEVETIDGRVIPLRIETICIHSDTPGAACIATEARGALESAGVEVVPLTKVLG
ncbi:MAG: 5-oxoprolinase subunit PxpA [Candidatus Eisenbacteria bacterium]|nr:5-oxoprolinase subunit PxpA [Candidatus Eisenbacteria bacterium]